VRYPNLKFTEFQKHTVFNHQLKGSGDRKEGRRKEKRNKAYLVLLLVDETSLFLREEVQLVRTITP
jgi:hypothetical protein